MEQLDLTTYAVGRPGIIRVRYTHDAMIDLVVQNPWISQGAIAAHFGYTESWVSSIFSSDSFQARLAARKEDLVDPTIRATLEDRMKALVLQSITVLQKRLEVDQTGDLALGVLNGAAKALGYGARTTPVVAVNNFVVHVPPKSVDSATWEREHAEGRAERLVAVVDGVSREGLIAATEGGATRDGLIAAEGGRDRPLLAEPLGEEEERGKPMGPPK